MIRPDAQTKRTLEEQAAIAYAASVRGAWIAAVFCLMVLGLILGNRSALKNTDPLNSPRIAAMTIRLAKDPRNPQLKESFRKLDLGIRRDYQRRLAFSHQGAYVLLVGVSLFLIAGASAAHHNRVLQQCSGCAIVVGPDEQDSDSARRSATLARRAVAVFGAVAALSLAALAILPGSDLTKQYLKATRGYHRTVAVADDSSSSAPMAAPGPSAPGPRPSPATASTSGGGTPAIPGGIKPLPVPGLPNSGNSATSGSKPAVTGLSPNSASKQPPAIRIQTVAFDENDYKPSVPDWAANWPVFRGPSGTGWVESAYPIKWDGKTGEGIAWKTEIPLPGWNSPVVWGDRIFTSGADKDKREIYCLDSATGKLIWSKPFAMLSKQVDVMEDTGYAPSTLAVDGKRVFAIFPNGDLGCWDFDGKQLWQKSLGNPENQYGHASSLTMYGSLLMVLFDQGSDGAEAKSLLMALQGETGACVWYAQRAVPNSWATPIIIDTGSRLELVTSANPWVISYDPMTGREFWRANLMSGDVAPSPVYAGGMVLACNSGAVLAAIKPGGSGDVTATQVAWKSTDGLPDIASPVANGELIFMADSGGNITCIDLKTGAKVWDHSYGTPFKASPAIAGSRVYLMDNEGVMHIIAAGRTFEEEAQCALSEEAGATPAFTNGRIYIRGAKHVYCVGKKG